MKIMICLAVVILVPFVPAEAQEPAKALPETKIVLRVSRRFIHRLVGPRFQRDEPINSNLGGGAATGTARVSGKFHITLHESKTESDFDVLSRGEVATQLTATRRPVEVHAHGTAPFNARRRIVLTQDLFTAQTLTMDVCNHFTLDEICTFRGGLPGAVTRRIARPIVRRGLADADRSAGEEIRTQLTQALETELDKLVLVLNQIPPLVKQAHALIIAENKLPPQGVRAYRAATKEHLLLSIGPPERRMPSLPNLNKDKQAPLELWIAKSKNASKEERRKFMLQNWRLIVPFLRDQLQRRSPELTEEIDEPLVQLLEEVQIHEMPGWHVVTFASKIPLPTLESP